MFRDYCIPTDDPVKERIYDNFQQNLNDILQAAAGARIPVLLSSVASNLRDCPPFGSTHGLGLDASNQTQWVRLMQSGATHADGGHWAEAAQCYQEAAQASPNHAEVQFRLGLCMLQLTNTLEAKRCFQRARDFDSSPFRADSRINEIIAAAGRRYAERGVISMDAESILQAASSDRILGGETFYEHVHLNFDGNYRLALAWAGSIASLLPGRILERAASAWATPETCEKRLGLSDWNRQTILEEVGRRISDAPFTNQWNHASRFQALQRQMLENKKRLTPSAAREARRLYEEAVAKHPGDHWLHHNYAEFLTTTGDLPGASRQMEVVRDLLPHHHAAYFQLGRLYARQKQYDLARESLQASLQLRPDLADVYLELGQLFFSQGKLEDAGRQYIAAQKLRPDDARVYLLQASLYEKQQKRSDAISSLREAIRRKPDYPEAHSQLGVELALDEKFTEAQAEFQEVVRLRPADAEGHLNLGIALARGQRFDEAVLQLETALRLEPGNAMAREFLTNIQKHRAQTPAINPVGSAKPTSPNAAGSSR